jgi:hypothetical protein
MEKWRGMVRWMGTGRGALYSEIVSFQDQIVFLKILVHFELSLGLPCG